MSSRGKKKKEEEKRVHYNSKHDVTYKEVKLYVVVVLFNQYTKKPQKV